VRRTRVPVPARVERQLHVEEKLRCRCGETILTADGAEKVYDKTRFGPTFMAQVAVSKCADSLPLYRQAKAYRRTGVQVDDSTLGDLFHRDAEICSRSTNGSSISSRRRRSFSPRRQRACRRRASQRTGGRQHSAESESTDSG
jgi:transposase